MVPKPNKDQLSIRTTGPNIDYKIFTKLLTNRLSTSHLSKSTSTAEMTAVAQRYRGMAAEIPKPNPMTWRGDTAPCMTLSMEAMELPRQMEALATERGAQWCQSLSPERQGIDPRNWRQEVTWRQILRRWL